ncbi:hypothetical protein NEOLEDRAFT_1182927 [Neolentinus lepideus HHB14362 ss-1]|uniref:Uncharacterized protein n=1 Tax=Neolentinus lepideus HHB14362 ss-1 TaxID=1314782 RepID=A0A165NRE5_9AGAM|nr:hypothetical protein NEOLEDRAFT_1182927 [Neolentinus lepideus HHB14362 ss-1]
MPSIKIAFKSLQAKLKPAKATDNKDPKPSFITRVFRKELKTSVLDADPVRISREVCPDLTASPTSTAAFSPLLNSSSSPTVTSSTPPSPTPNPKYRRRLTSEEVKKIERWAREPPKIRMRPVKPAPSLLKSIFLTPPPHLAPVPKDFEKRAEHLAKLREKKQQSAHVQHLIRMKAQKQQRRGELQVKGMIEAIARELFEERLRFEEERRAIIAEKDEEIERRDVEIEKRDAEIEELSDVAGKLVEEYGRMAELWKEESQRKDELLHEYRLQLAANVLGYGDLQ